MDERTLEELNAELDRALEAGGPPIEDFMNRPLDLIDAGVVADTMRGAQVSAKWEDGGGRPRAASYGKLNKALIATPPDWGLTLWLGEETWLWIDAATITAADVFSAPSGPVLKIVAGELSVTVDPHGYA